MGVGHMKPYQAMLTTGYVMFTLAIALEKGFATACSVGGLILLIAGFAAWSMTI
jgi:hypothetical protein